MNQDKIGDVKSEQRRKDDKVLFVKCTNKSWEQRRISLNTNLEINYWKIASGEYKYLKAYG